MALSPRANSLVSLEQVDLRPQLPAEVWPILRETFGLKDFRPYQARLVYWSLQGDDTFGILPTSGGKSLTYQLPAEYHRQRGLGVTIVVSPLISLSIDQVDELKRKGIAAARFDSSQDPAEDAVNIEKIARGEVSLVYVSPERFCSIGFQSEVFGVGTDSPVRVATVVLDEAHTISEWGHDFRPKLGKNLGAAIWRLGANASRPVTIRGEDEKEARTRPPVQLCTATAPSHIRDDIEKTLGLGRPMVLIAGELDRPNLTYSLRHFPSAADKKEALVAELKRTQDQPTIIYCAKRATTEKLQEFLEENRIKARAYHAGMENPDRLDAQNAFMSGKCNILIATNAFGMGINKGDISRVIHYNIPKSVEQYYQESGRAARSIPHGRCMLWVTQEDCYLPLHFIELANPEKQFMRKTYQLLWDHFLDAGERSAAVPKATVDMKKFRGEDEEANLPKWYYALTRSSLAALQEFHILDINGWNVKFLVKPAQFDARFPDEEVLRAKKEQALQSYKLMLYLANQADTRDHQDGSVIAKLPHSDAPPAGRTLENIANSHIRTMLLMHLEDNLLAQEAVRFKHPAELIDIDRQRVARIVERVARRDWGFEELKRYIIGQAKEKVEGDMPFKRLERFEVEAVIKHAAWLGYIRLHSRGERIWLSLAPSGREFLMETGSRVADQDLQPSRSWEQVRCRMGHFAERDTLRLALFEWLKTRFADVADPAQLKAMLDDFAKASFTVMGTRVTGRELTRGFCGNEDVNQSQMRALLRYLAGFDPLQAGAKIFN